MKFFLFIFLSVSFVFFGCSRFQRIQSSSNYERKYEAAVGYYKNKNYYKALLLFEELLILF